MLVTAFTWDAATTIAMQNAAEKTVRCIVRLVALKDLALGAGLPFFMRERPSPWGLVVERVIAVTEPERRAAKQREPRKRSPR